MATYPSIDAQTKVTPKQTLKIDISEGGDLRAQDLTAADMYDIDIEHPWIDAADVTTLQSFFATNKNLTITTQTLADGNTYDCLMVKGPVVLEHNGIFRTVKQKLVGTRN